MIFDIGFAIFRESSGATYRAADDILVIGKNILKITSFVFKRYNNQSKIKKHLYYK